MTPQRLRLLTEAIYTIAFQFFDREPEIDEPGRLARAIESRAETFLEEEFEVEL